MASKKRIRRSGRASTLRSAPAHPNFSAIHFLINDCRVTPYPPLTPRTQSRTDVLIKTLSSTELRANLSAVMDRVNDDHEPVIVHRAKGKPVVMVSLEDWASMDETAYLLSSPANARMLREGIADLDPARMITKTMAELEAMAEE